MRNSPVVCSAWLAVACVAISVPAWAQSFRVQCPASTTLHPGERSPAYTGPVTMTGALTADNKAAIDYVSNGGGIKCQQISGGDGYATMGDGTVTYLFGFGPLSGLSDLANGGPGTQYASVFNQSNIQAVYDVWGSVQNRDLGSVAAAIQKIVAEAEPQLKPGNHIVVRGQIESMKAAFGNLTIGLLFAAVFVYMLMVVNYQSFLDPFAMFPRTLFNPVGLEDADVSCGRSGRSWPGGRDPGSDEHLGLSSSSASCFRCPLSRPLSRRPTAL